MNPKSHWPFPESDGLTDNFIRGFKIGLDPYKWDSVRVTAAPHRDAITIHLGNRFVSLSGLEMVQSSDMYGLGYVKGVELRQKAREP
jgi:hypothetical protein